MVFVTDILDWMLFNVVMGNCDAHGKNLSFFSGKNGLAVAPWYDLVSVEMLEGVNHTMAMSVAGEFSVDAIGLKELALECRQVGVTQELLQERLSKMLQRLMALDLDTLLPDGLTDSDNAFAKRFTAFLKMKIRCWCRNCNFWRGRSLKFKYEVM